MYRLSEPLSNCAKFSGTTPSQHVDGRIPLAPVLVLKKKTPICDIWGGLKAIPIGGLQFLQCVSILQYGEVLHFTEMHMMTVRFQPGVVEISLILIFSRSYLVFHRLSRRS